MQLFFKELCKSTTHIVKITVSQVATNFLFNWKKKVSHLIYKQMIVQRFDTVCFAFVPQRSSKALIPRRCLCPGLGSNQHSSSERNRTSLVAPAGIEYASKVLRGDSNPRYVFPPSLSKPVLKNDQGSHGWSPMINSPVPPNGSKRDRSIVEGCLQLILAL